MDLSTNINASLHSKILTLLVVTKVISYFRTNKINKNFVEIRRKTNRFLFK
jgi:hypothetical protein